MMTWPFENSTEGIKDVVEINYDGIWEWILELYDAMA